MIVNNTNIEELEDYFLDLFDISNQTRIKTGADTIKIEMNISPFISLRSTTKFKKTEIVLESEYDKNSIQVRNYGDGLPDCCGTSPIKITKKIIDYPREQKIKNVNFYNIEIDFPCVISNSLESIIKVSVERLKRYYEISEFHQNPTLGKVKIKILNIEDYNEFRNMIDSSKETHDLELSNYASGINNYFPI